MCLLGTCLVPHSCNTNCSVLSSFVNTSLWGDELDRFANSLIITHLTKRSECTVGRGELDEAKV